MVSFCQGNWGITFLNFIFSLNYEYIRDSEIPRETGPKWSALMFKLIHDLKVIAIQNWNLGVFTLSKCNSDDGILKMNYFEDIQLP